MKFDKVVLASFLALSLVACGGDDDKSKPDDDKNKDPEKSAECVEAGDKCKLIDGKWVIEKDEDEPAPTVDSDFDYSGIGVTDKLLPERKGFGFYHKGAQSPLDAKRFAKNRPTLSPVVAWSSAIEYDEDLWNYVAITPHKEEGGSKGELKYMFDEIGKTNHTNNQNLLFFGKTSISSTTGDVGKSSFDERDAISSGGTENFVWNRVPAVVNTFIYEDANNNWQRVYANADKKIWWNDEADERAPTEGGGSGKQSTRVYGVNAFLTTNNNEAINTEKQKPAGSDKYNLPNRQDTDYIQHANFAYWEPSDRSSKTVNEDDSGWKLVPAKNAFYAQVDGGKPEKRFPTDLNLGELKYTQFGRLSGAGVTKDAKTLPQYPDTLIRLYPFNSGANAAAGNAKSEDWYFARGTAGTPLAVLDSLKERGGNIIYDGQAVMFGLDYDPIKTMPVGKPDEQEGTDKSTNSVMPKKVVATDDKILKTTILDGKHNLVRIIWTPENGHINGHVYGIWTTASYWKALKDLSGGITANQIIPFKTTGLTGAEAEPNTGASTGFDLPSGNTLTSIDDAKNIIDNAAEIGVRKEVLVDLKGSVIEGTNSFSGVALRVKQNDKGIFTGGFFGPNASEIGGVINSQTGDMNNPELADPAQKWGGAFGAQTGLATDETLEYLDIPDDPTFDYDASNEVF